MPNTEEYIGVVISDVARLLRTEFDRRVRRLGITRGQWLVLTRLHRRPGASHSELAEMMEVEKSDRRPHDRPARGQWLGRTPRPTRRPARKNASTRRPRPSGYTSASGGSPRIRLKPRSPICLPGRASSSFALLQRVKATLVSGANGPAKGSAVVAGREIRLRAANAALQRQDLVVTPRQRKLALIGVPVLVIVGAFAVWLQGGRHVTTENAFVEADITQIASEIPGRIIEVRITDHSIVKADELLVRLDPRTLPLALAKAEADVDSARAAVEQLKASLREIRAETREAENKLTFLQAQAQRARDLVRDAG